VYKNLGEILNDNHKPFVQLRVAFLFLLLLIAFVTTDSFAAQEYLSIEHYKVANDGFCSIDRTVGKMVDDFERKGFNGDECISDVSELSISGKVISAIELSPNKYSDKSLNVYDVRMKFNQMVGLDSDDKGLKKIGNYALFIEDYLLGVFDCYAEKAGKMYFLVTNPDVDELVRHLNMLNRNIKTQVIKD